MVLVGHIQYHVMDRQFVDKSGFNPFLPLFWGGGVDVFFVISGFIMYQLSQDRFGLHGATRNFILKRLVRIVPLYWIFTTAMLIVIWRFPENVVHSDISVLQVIGSYLFIPVANPYLQFSPVLIAGWTLNFEALFYALFAIALLFERKTGLVFVACALSLLGIVGIVLPFKETALAFWCNPIVLEFLLGIWLARQRSTGFCWSLSFGLMVSAIGFAAMIVLKQMGIAEHYWIWRPVWMGVPALAVCAGLTLCPESSNAGFWKRLLIFGGDSSYSLYLSHPFAIGLATLVFLHFGFKNPWLYISFAAALSLAGAAIVFLMVEKPVGILVSRLRERREIVN
jgi:exopolysaccharide production protein ExoZ